MDDPGRRHHGPAKRWLRGPLVVVAVAVALWLVSGTLGEPGGQQSAEATPTPAPAVKTVVATEAQVTASNMAAAGTISARRKRVKRKWVKTKRVKVESRISDSESPILTEEGKGNYVRLVCPGGAVAISGGMVTKFINLLMSSSSPNNPVTGKYTPRSWWVTVTNANVDGQGGTYAWRGVVNCMKPVKLKK